MSTSAKVKFMPSYLTEDSICVVCHQKASGKHYGAIACEGCKGFFRRTIQHSRQNKYTCIGKSNNCCLEMMTKTTKFDRYCQSCRYSKCIASGFQTDKVLDSFRRIAQNQLRADNKRRRQLKESTLRQNRVPEQRTNDLCLGPYRHNICDSSRNQTDLNNELIHVKPQVDTSTHDSRIDRKMSRSQVDNIEEDVMKRMTDSLRKSIMKIPASDVKVDDVESDNNPYQVPTTDSDYTKTVLSQMFLRMIWSAKKYVRLIARDIFNFDEVDTLLMETESIWELVVLMLSSRCDPVTSHLIMMFQQQTSALTNCTSLVTLLSTVVNYGNTLAEWHLDELALSLTAAIITFCSGKLLYLETANFSKVSNIRAALCTWLTQHLRNKRNIVNDFELGPFFRLINELNFIARPFGELACQLFESNCFAFPQEILPQPVPYQRRKKFS